jgi:hypothetical protein
MARGCEIEALQGPELGRLWGGETWMLKTSWWGLLSPIRYASGRQKGPVAARRGCCWFGLRVGWVSFANWGVGRASA